jgi:hypothetical protein
MKRFHVHVSVANLADSITFYNHLFGSTPSKERPDYAKWMLQDPPLNFAISARGHATGINHLGFQAENAEELADLKMLAEAASGEQVINQGEAACCYAKSEKHWTVDPQGLAWEHFHTMAEAQEFGHDSGESSGACCIPVRSSEKDSEIAKSACCIPKTESAVGSCCN